MTPQIAPIHRTAHMRQSHEKAFPLRNADGLTWAEVKTKKEARDER